MKTRPSAPQTAPAPRNPVALALAARAGSGAAGRHQRATGAQRRADRVALQQALRRGDGH